MGQTPAPTPAPVPFEMLDDLPYERSGDVCYCTDSEVRSHIQGLQAKLTELVQIVEGRGFHAQRDVLDLKQALERIYRRLGLGRNG